ncbi:MAG: hypothetical protein ABW080_07165 [Candidatus Thiodiazotropha sp.]
MIAWLYHRLPPRIIYPTPEQGKFRASQSSVTWLEKMLLNE